MIKYRLWQLTVLTYIPPRPIVEMNDLVFEIIIWLHEISVQLK